MDVPLYGTCRKTPQAVLPLLFPAILEEYEKTNSSEKMRVAISDSLVLLKQL
jgi:hypothetical protein